MERRRRRDRSSDSDENSSSLSRAQIQHRASNRAKKEVVAIRDVIIRSRSSSGPENKRETSYSYSGRRKKGYDSPHNNHEDTVKNNSDNNSDNNDTNDNDTNDTNEINKRRRERSFCFRESESRRSTNKHNINRKEEDEERRRSRRRLQKRRGSLSSSVDDLRCENDNDNDKYSRRRSVSSHHRSRRTSSRRSRSRRRSPYYNRTSQKRSRRDSYGDNHKRDDEDDDDDDDDSDDYHHNGNRRNRRRSPEHVKRETSEERRERYAEREQDRERERDRIREERANRELERMKREQGQRQQRELEEASRDDCTVLILNLDLKSSERNVYEFFTENSGKVRDVQIIRDQRSGRSKGVAYVEFYTQDSVIKALACNGMMIGTQPIGVQASQAEKNRAAKAAKQQQAEVIEGTMKLFVGGLINSLSHISTADLSEIFGCFGEITDVQLPTDSYTGKCKGFGFVKYRRAADAREALMSLNGFKIADQPLRVGMVMGETKGLPEGTTHATTLERQVLVLQQQQELISGGNAERLDDDDEGGGLLSGAGSKLALMQKLQRREPNVSSNNGDGGYTGSDKLSTQSSSHIHNHNNPISSLSSNLVLATMFEAREVIEASSEKERNEMVQDILDDVKDECKKYGDIVHIWCDASLKADGRVWLKFGQVDQAVRAAQHLQGRLFGGKPIKAEFVPDPVYDVATKRG